MFAVRCDLPISRRKKCHVIMNPGKDPEAWYYTLQEVLEWFSERGESHFHMQSNEKAWKINFEAATEKEL